MSNNRTPFDLVRHDGEIIVAWKHDAENRRRHITIIAAMDQNAAIGKDNKIPWYVSEDFAHFKRMTKDHPVIMGRKTYESLPVNEQGKPALDDRQLIVITHNSDYRAEYNIGSEVMVVGSLEAAIEACGQHQVFIIGGESVYHQALAVADSMLLTAIGTQVMDTDCFFPIREASEDFEVAVAQSWHNKSKKSPYLDYSFQIWQRVKAQ